MLQVIFRAPGFDPHTPLRPKGVLLCPVSVGSCSYIHTYIYIFTHSQISISISISISMYAYIAISLFSVSISIPILISISMSVSISISIYRYIYLSTYLSINAFIHTYIPQVVNPAITPKPSLSWRMSSSRGRISFSCADPQSPNFNPEPEGVLPGTPQGFTKGMVPGRLRMTEPCLCLS